MKSNELPFVSDMFNRIAPHYDLLNRLLSLRQDVYWRRTLVNSLDVKATSQVLDVACGTGDVALEIARRMKGHGIVTGVDFAPGMLRLAEPKIRQANNAAKVVLAAGDAFDLPFERERFDAITIAFGIRNIQDKATVLERFYEHLKPGGRVAILELATPDQGLLRSFYLGYFNRLLPKLGRLFSKHSYAYSYLPQSVAQFPAAGVFAAMMRAAGFEKVRYRKMTMGIAVLFVGDKPIV